MKQVIAIIAVCVLACAVMYLTGIVVHEADGSAHFWFESDLRSWIHGV